MSNQPLYPEQETLQRFIQNRNRWAGIWHIIFIASTIVGIIALTALLYNIINGSFGYVAVQDAVDPQALVLAVEEEQMLTANHTLSSEDDNELVDGIVGNPHAIGFFGYAYYNENQDDLKILSIDGVPATAETAESKEYLLARPLFLYSTAEVMHEKPAVAAFINFYLNTVDDVIDEVGYFPATEKSLEQARQNWLQAMETAEMPPVEPEAVPDEEPLVMAGSSTVYPLSRKIAIEFRKAGYKGVFELDSVGSSGGFKLFCQRHGTDVSNASRQIKRAEVEMCQKVDRDPVEFRVGTDAIAVVVSRENDFLENVTLEELRAIFTTAENWSDVNPNWPDAPIERFIPGADSGTLDFFAESVFKRNLDDLPKETLIAILENNISAGRMRFLASEQTFEERSREDVLELVRAEVVHPSVVKSWLLSDSIFNKAEIEEAVAAIPQGHLEFRSWITWDFIVTPQSSVPEQAGIRTAILGTLWTIFITIAIAFPIGVGAAIYLEEYAAHVGNPILRRINNIIQVNINNLAGVPSIIYGMLGLAIFARILEAITSGALFGVADPTTANGRTVLSAGLTLALLILPLIIINAQEAIRAVPNSLRQAGMGLGATKWQTIWHHVLPNALPGILTGNILAMSRAIGETAPLVVVGASTFITVDPTSPFSKFTTLTIQIYQWTARPQEEFRNIAAAGIIVLLVMLLSLNASAVLLRNRFSRRLS